MLLRSEEIFSNAEEMGLIVETTVLRHLYAYYYQDTPEIAYWRDAATGREVDIIVRSPAYALPVEIKYRGKPELEKKGGLVTWCHAEKPPQACLVARRDDDFSVSRLDDLPTRFLKVPAHVLCYLLGQTEKPTPPFKPNTNSREQPESGTITMEASNTHSRSTQMIGGTVIAYAIQEPKHVSEAFPCAVAKNVCNVFD